MKAQFFMNMNEIAENKNDELKYLILMREEFFKYKLKLYYFTKWKCRALYNRDLINEENPFYNNSKYAYQQFKNNYTNNNIGQSEIFDSNMSSKNINNFNDNKADFNNFGNNENIFGNNNAHQDNVSSFKNGNNFDFLIFDETKKKLDNQNEKNNNNLDKIFQLNGSNLSFGGNQNDNLNSIFNSLNNLKKKQ